MNGSDLAASRSSVAASEILKRRSGSRAAILPADSRIRRLLALSDGIAVIIALSVDLGLNHEALPGMKLLWGLVAIPLMVVLFKLYGLYDRDVKRMSHSTVDDIPWLCHAIGAGTLILWLYAKSTPMHRMDFSEVVLFAGSLLFCSTVGRWLVRVGCARWLEPDIAVLLGSGPMADLLVGKLRAHPEYRSCLVGCLRPGNVASSESELPTLGEPSDLDAVVERLGVSRVIVSPAHIDESELEDVLRHCRKLALKVSLLPQFSDVLGPAVELDDVEGVTVLGVNPPWLSRSSQAIKRTLDIAVAGTLLLVALPVVATVAIVVRLDSPGPVFFRQRRVGKAGEVFTLLKFRTMVVDAEERRAALLKESKDPNWLHLDVDPRITRVGRFLRVSSLDELPQLWNVLRGQMSMVGPRPLIETEDERVQGWARGRLDLTPGITGYWQVLGRTRIPFDEMVKLDYLYVMNWSLWTDLRLMLMTVPTVVGRRGAN
jgi:exopolysaccharide biosynthesis polyprenyl glycosylphosphotransferase